MGRVEDTKHGAVSENGGLIDRPVSVGEFRQFVTQTGYLSDCEKFGGGWVLTPKKQWARKVDACWDNPYRPQEEDDPVALVSWYDAVRFANWRSAREGLALAYLTTEMAYYREVVCDFGADGYRLPTEIEWEQVAGADFISAAGKSKLSRRKSDGASAPGLPPVPWCEGGDWGHQLEWCWDASASSISQEKPDALRAPMVAARICRGIGNYHSISNTAPGCRGRCNPLTAAGTLGFRLVKGGKHSRQATLFKVSH